MGKKDKKRHEVWVAGRDGGRKIYLDQVVPRDEKEMKSNRFWLILTLIFLGLFVLSLLFLKYS